MRFVRPPKYDTYNQSDSPTSNLKMQQFKTVYFPDLASGDQGRRGLTIAFTEDETSLYKLIEPLSSVRLRALLGHSEYGSLEAEASRLGLSINAFCRNRIQESVGAGRLNGAVKFADELQATFSGGRHDPLHDWFPYLEGYSPDFVWEIAARYAPHAKRFLDPFAGSGTTPITIMSMGGVGLFSDVNPICIDLISAKGLAHTLSNKRRAAVVSNLNDLADNLRKLVGRAKPDVRLEKTHRLVFGDSVFFDREQYLKVLRYRSVLDTLSDNDVTKFATVAALRSLVGASLLIRRGDLRFKTSHELARGSNDFINEVIASLRLIASDIAALSGTSGGVELVGRNALENEYHQTVDAIITSPPYLNGTNYFRNTKIELWFARYLQSKADLARFRQLAVTAGINDVTKRKASERGNLFKDAELTRIVSKMEKTAYDPRIPLMVGTYFSDISVALSRAASAVSSNGVIAIDIGDSSYGGIHVPTDKILARMLAGLGLKQVEQVVLRERMSRSGDKLKQTLLVFQKASEQLPSGWTSFKRDLPHRTNGMAARNWGHPLHSLCSYQGKLKPSIAHSLVRTFVPDNGKLLDPFAGVGTIPFEAALNGRLGLGFEISPSAFFIADAKMRRPSMAEVELLLQELAAFIDKYTPTHGELKSAKEVDFNSSIPEYFHPDTLREVLAARRFFAKKKRGSAAYSLLHACTQHILHGNRPYALSRRSHPLTPYAPTGPFEYRSLLDRLRTKASKSLAAEVGSGFAEGKIWLQDCTAKWPDAVSDLDAIITSPPFFDSTRFYLANWMRLWFSGWERSSFRSEPQRYVDERQKQSFDVYDAIFTQARERLKNNGVVVLHLGKSKKCDMAAELQQVARRHFKVADLFDENVEHCERHGVRDKGSVTSHQYLVLTK